MMLVNPYRFVAAAPGATLDPAATAVGGVLSNGNLTLSRTSGTVVCARATVGATTGRRYFEAVLDSISTVAPAVGIQSTSGALTTDLGQETAEYGLRANGSGYFNGNFGAFTSASSTGAIIMVAVDFSAKRVWFGRNGVWFNAGDPASGLNPATTFTTTAALYPTVQVNGTAVVTVRLAPDAFGYAPPTGFTAW